MVRLVELGADVNARDVTDCTPLQNAAHGTYSALAAVPSTQQAAGGAWAQLGGLERIYGRRGKMKGRGGEEMV